MRDPMNPAPPVIKMVPAIWSPLVVHGVDA
jgi:hypothetical protein